ncbi:MULTISPECIES: M20 family metallopeptidase [unclassified Halomonas]|uniref:M20 family metallopeptidase n=1 Tax=unclassified Halomonas TaxID=2609666 RepID=UPI00047F63C4|nr:MULTISPECIES: M20 family metallopeptidase [unclassified Halomonas]KIN15828.1 peptidase M20 [Halomonas sp. KHS3]NAO96170.1 M20/M25/M40 family metallo-hydrolase [Halomonas sp. MG34]PKH58615.1 peptidase M20 [Halomonas sp. Choline-3u-9]QGQ69494.1 M20 family metallopeptidase [Halomonas sp. PA16-9]
MNTLHTYLQEHQRSILDDIEALVRAESPSNDKAAVDACGQMLRQLFQDRLQCQAETFPQTEKGDHLGFTLGEGDRQILILGHFDTVWDIGRLAIRRETDKFYGPGILDMKAGIVQAIWAVKALVELDALPNARIRFLCTSDEELGSPTSRQRIEEESVASDVVLVVEPATANGSALKTARKGSGRFYMHITGKAAHAGNNPEEGVSAIEELSHQIQYLHSLADPGLGTTVNVGMVRGGGPLNVVPEEAELGIDVRVTTLEEAGRLYNAIYQSTPFHPSVMLTVSGDMTRPPMERTHATARLFELAQHAAGAFGIELTEASVGGGSDGNFAAAKGIPTLDGLGATGAAPHAEYEHIEIASIVPRAAILAALIRQA